MILLNLFLPQNWAWESQQQQKWTNKRKNEKSSIIHCGATLSTHFHAMLKIQMLEQIISNENSADGCDKSDAGSVDENEVTVEYYRSVSSE